jgi:hypothetical protein
MAPEEAVDMADSGSRRELVFRVFGADGSGTA